MRLAVLLLLFGLGIDAWLELLSDGPGEAEHLAGGGRRHHMNGLAGGDQPAIAGAEPALPLPGDVADLLGKPFQALEVVAGDPGRQAVGPGGLTSGVSASRTPTPTCSERTTCCVFHSRT